MAIENLGAALTVLEKEIAVEARGFFEELGEIMFRTYQLTAPVDTGEFQRTLDWRIDDLPQGLAIVFTTGVDYGIFVEALHHPIADNVHLDSALRLVNHG